MNLLRLQSLSFISIAAAACTYHVFFGLPQGQASLLVLILCIVFLGIPHGALDTLYGGQLFGIHRPSRWLLFTAAYLLPVGFVLLLWPFWSPFLFALFLVVSTVHFSGDPQPKCPFWLRTLYGGIPIVFPTLLHRGEVKSLFTSLVAEGSATGFVGVLSFMVFPWLVAFTLGAAWYAKYQRRAAIEMIAAGALCCVGPPLFAFTLFFCFMHSARHILRSLEAGEVPLPVLQQNAKKALLAAAAPMFGTLLILGFYWQNIESAALEPRLLQTVFVALAALTFPHVLLVDYFYHWAGKPRLDSRGDHRENLVESNAIVQPGGNANAYET